MHLGTIQIILNNLSISISYLPISISLNLFLPSKRFSTPLPPPPQSNIHKFQRLGCGYLLESHFSVYDTHSLLPVSFKSVLLWNNFRFRTCFRSSRVFPYTLLQVSLRWLFYMPFFLSNFISIANKVGYNVYF